MGRLKFFVIYVWIEFIIFPNWFVSAKPITHSNHNKFTRTSIEYNLQNLGDDSLLTTDVDLEHNKDHARITNKDKNDHKLQLSLPVEPEKQEMSAGYKPKYRTHRFRHNNSQKGKNDNIIGNSRVVVNRKSREDDSSDDFQDDDHIRSKDEDDEDDVQLIIIPRKPHKRLRPKVQDEEDDRKTTGESDSKDLDEVKDNSEDSLNSDDSDNTQADSQNILDKKPHRHKESDDGETLSVERVAADEDVKGSHKTAGKLGDYDLHVKVKDKSGTNVKLSGDLPGNIGNLVAEGEGGGRVQVQNNKNKANLKLGPQDVKDGSNEEDASTDDIAQNLIKMKSGKLKHAPYPSTILLKPSPSDQDPLLNGADDSSITSAETSNVNQEISLLKSKGNDKYSSDEVSTSVLKSPSEQSVREANNNDQTDKRPGSNVFSSMEFENGDDELMATSRLLDIARKVDDESSLKDVKDSSNSRPPSSPSGSSGKQRSTTSSKPVKLAPEDYRKQSDQIDKESNDNWYKLQSLQDEIVKEGSSAKPGKIMGSYNGQDVSIVNPGQLQLLQTEYPSYPAYLTPLQREKVKDN